MAKSNAAAINVPGPLGGPAPVIRIPKTAEVIARWLRKEMLRAKLKPGAPLPSENALRERFNVSRPTIREALRILETQQLVTIARGASGGARFALPEIDMVAGFMGVYLQAHGASQRDLHSARLTIEPGIIASMAGTLTQEGLDKLRESIARHAAVTQDIVAFGHRHEEFYALLAALCPNPPLAVLLTIFRALIQAQSDLLGRDYAAGLQDMERDLKGIVRMKTKLVDLLEAGDAEACEALWRRSLEAQLRRMQGLGLSEREIEAP